MSSFLKQIAGAGLVVLALGAAAQVHENEKRIAAKEAAAQERYEAALKKGEEQRRARQARLEADKIYISNNTRCEYVRGSKVCFEPTRFGSQWGEKLTMQVGYGESEVQFLCVGNTGDIRRSRIVHDGIRPIMQAVANKYCTTKVS